MMTMHEHRFWRLITNTSRLAGLRDRLDWRENMRRLARTEADIERVAFSAMVVWCCIVGVGLTVAAAWLLSLE
jgi:hypothetical protein